jgi:hypothetical protein
MNHPGPPQFVEVGESVELAPRDPEPAGTYSWELTTAPAESAVTLGDDPVEQFAPDEAGRYVTTLSAPDGEHRLTIRAISDSRPLAVRTSDTDTTPTASAVSETDETVEPSDDDGGQPRLSLEPVVEDDQVVVRADPQPHPDSTETPADLAVVFLIDDRDDIDRAVASTSGRALRLPVDTLPDLTRVYAVAVGGHGYSVPDAVAFERTQRPRQSGVTHRRSPRRGRTTRRSGPPTRLYTRSTSARSAVTPTMHRSKRCAIGSTTSSRWVWTPSG